MIERRELLFSAHGAELELCETDEGDRHLYYRSDGCNWVEPISFGIEREKAEIVSETPDAEELIERAGRVCYKSEPKGDPDGFIRARIRQGHTSILEHASFTARIVTNRAIATEITRHRHTAIPPAISMESTRYVDYNGGIALILPPDCATWTTTQRAVHWSLWVMDGNQADSSYRTRRGHGIQPEYARGGLLLDTASEMYFTANMREWREIFRLRTDKAAHPQASSLMNRLLQQAVEKWPVLFEDLAASNG